MSRRTERVGKVIQQAIGQILRRELSDPRIDTARTSITRVSVQEDLLRAKVYISVIGSEGDQGRVVAALNHAAGRVQAQLRSQISLRQMPVLSFHTDHQFKGAIQTWTIIQEAMEEIEQKQRRREATTDADGDQTAEATPPNHGPEQDQ